MKEDILEQIVDDYLQHLGYFTRHNIRFRPSHDSEHYDSQQDSVSSDIDIIGINPQRQGPEAVMVVSCKSWQHGFRPGYWIEAIEKNKVVHGKEAWRTFRELANPKWSQPFVAKVKELTGSETFTYVTAVTKLIDDAEGTQRRKWETHPRFLENIAGRSSGEPPSRTTNPIRILTMREMLDTLYANEGKTPAASDLGRMLQLVKASGWQMSSAKAFEKKPETSPLPVPEPAAAGMMQSASAQTEAIAERLAPCTSA
ncbi:MAG: hypothetical protein Q4D19_08355 [Lautropia sp.]|nr:hypothetical protein [Lautropia sp.]